MTTRDQKRALRAYERVGAIKKEEKGAAFEAEYRGYALGLGPTVVRSGLAAALAFIERDGRKREAARCFLADLAGAGIPGLAPADGNVAGAARELSLDSYMLATRETLKVCVWFKRAVQALLEPKP